LKKKYNGRTKEFNRLIKKRAINGKIDQQGKTYAEWSKTGRINHLNFIGHPFYVKNNDALKRGLKEMKVLHNHQTSNQSTSVINRLKVIMDEGGYRNAQERLKELGLSSNKRSYSLLEPNKQSPTVMTIADDYVHYDQPRALTVREMARLQSFDDSFVFQGKRSTGGNKRKFEVPQYTLVGNAVPPLLARAIGKAILENIK